MHIPDGRNRGLLTHETPAENEIDPCRVAEADLAVAAPPSLAGVDDMTREAVRAILRRGLEQTHGSYPLVATQFNVPDADYRKFMRFCTSTTATCPSRVFACCATSSRRRHTRRWASKAERGPAGWSSR